MSRLQFQGFKLVPLVLCAGLLSGCAMTGNPREGGIFWSESKARRRLDERQGLWGAASEDAEAAQDEAARKRKRRDQLESTVADQRHQLADLSQEIRSLRQSVVESGNVAGQEEDVAKLERERQRLETSDASASQKQADIQKLRAEVEKLKKLNARLKQR